MPKLIGKSETVVEVDGLKIDELAGNVATSNDQISIAYVTVSEPTAEPWLTLDYDEWLCVLKGKMVLHYHPSAEDGTGDDENPTILEVNAGETCFVAKGERFRPVFPVAPTEYVPVCLPAFRPDRCHREEGEINSDVTNKLLKLHKMEDMAGDVQKKIDEKDIIYHMCEKHLWEEACQNQKAYYPPTFEKDGYFTHASSVPQRLVETANHFYQSSKADWICLQLSRTALASVGIITKDESAKPVGDTADMQKNNDVIYPHIYGGIPTLSSLKVLTATFPMRRSDKGEFLNIVGLTD